MTRCCATGQRATIQRASRCQTSALRVVNRGKTKMRVKVDQKNVWIELIDVCFDIQICPIKIENYVAFNMGRNNEAEYLTYTIVTLQESATAPDDIATMKI
uniref:Uncharacterized protein n=1 Tax=Peronospora matthiolae TaxID=2874970 RepID=A0AAV1UQB2_9STRA